jgi:hypothetical protein
MRCSRRSTSTAPYTDHPPGGAILQVYAAVHPGELAGVVLADTWTAARPGSVATTTAEVWAGPTREFRPPVPRRRRS